MPVYKFQCDRCGQRRQEYMTFEDHERNVLHTEGKVVLDEFHYCDEGEGRVGFFAQVFDFMYMRPMPEHYSPFIDGIVRSRRDYDDQVKIKEAEMSERMGYDVHYEEIDPTDAKAAQVTDEGLESQEEAHFYLDRQGVDEDAALFTPDGL